MVVGNDAVGLPNPDRHVANQLDTVVVNKSQNDRYRKNVILRGWKDLTLKLRQVASVIPKNDLWYLCSIH